MGAEGEGVRTESENTKRKASQEAVLRGDGCRSEQTQPSQPPSVAPALPVYALGRDQLFSPVDSFT